ncbi:MAG: CCA tRNA nucleotidyltransferase [Alphaproteobacteria bacterium]
MEPGVAVGATAPPERDPRRARRAAETVVARLRAAGHEALFAGGCVRDLLLGREPLDYDVATSAPSPEVQRIFPRTVPVGVQFGVVLVLEHGEKIEVATFRSDGRYVDHRHPVEVTPSDARGDAQRRDFTVNGMFLDPERPGEPIDFVGGRADLERGVLRAIGDPRARFDEDRLRLLRAVRFSARFGWEIEPGTRAAIESLAPTVTTIAWERIGDEIVKILLEGGARRGFEMLEATGLLAAVLPEVAEMRRVEQSPDHHPEGDVLTHTMLCLGRIEPSRHPEHVALSLLLHDVEKRSCAERRPDGRITFHGHCERGAETAAAIVRRLRRSGDVEQRVEWLVRRHLSHVDAPRMRTSTLRRFLGEPWVDDLLEVVRIDALSGSGDLGPWEFCRASREALPARATLPEPLLRGRDLLDLGYPAGPRLGEILDRAFDAQLEGEIADPAQARSWALRHFPPGEGKARG